MTISSSLTGSKRALSLSFVAFLMISQARAQTPATANSGEYLQRMHSLYTDIYRYFYDSSQSLFFEKSEASQREKPHSYLWPLCAMVQATNEMEAAEPAHHAMQPIIKAIDSYLSNKPPTAGYDSYVVKEGGGDRFYDDNQWIGIAYMDAWKRTGRKDLLRKATVIYHFMMSGFDTLAGGGLHWKEHDLRSKNTCSNGPGVILALRLYQATGRKSFLDTALLLYRWTSDHLMAPSGVYYDAIRTRSLKIDSATYTYNTGTMIQSGVLLYRITGNEQYLRQAEQSAQASLARFYRDNRFPHNSWFNAVLMRGYVELYEADKDKRYLEAMMAHADRQWSEGRNANGLFIERKGGPALLEQAGWLEIIARIAWLKERGF